MKKLLVVLFMSLFAVPTFAEAIYDEAKIVRVTEAFHTVRVPQKPECWNEDVAVPARQQGNDRSLMGPIIGGVVGGVLGHQVGKGSGNTAATVAGAVGGTIVGDRIGNSPNSQASGAETVRSERRCRDVPPREVQKSEGYDVTYEYAGRTETVRVQRNPMNQQTLRVRITPVIE